MHQPYGWGMQTVYGFVSIKCRCMLVGGFDWHAILMPRQTCLCSQASGLLRRVLICVTIHGVTLQRNRIGLQLPVTLVRYAPLAGEIALRCLRYALMTTHSAAQFFQKMVFVPPTKNNFFKNQVFCGAQCR